ncbi:bifunctional (p)ppGpp synthetase/guanosine-3',5'-bis(diphosphate) 3'-pyrophosphohydrolase [Oxalobacter aliiformigenes]|uniref:GTP pyrophosphokinase n=1 Tax=Oxalobacter aliiformigenes TaxID=2946593 RepID=A0ABY7JIY2_9BURK|nr:bifunctional (p)ppGpp synthetase/guanosine-3',5'-bis(diphosphate) 3'-pyrophosphohydrolase [Oxalobacter aliiformigenes]WAV93856.1 bifunctional (p)ppGpp synthetase/guanosine-3',5'-bis(diphosphate) 3'-pyrophosphohydrolase [Oxalobacter aliiformigenes]WAV94643.1 bifunctional (p)ppGpp synthetase/guanosine-3',5'-bis(diphosphate) 3'-pyrophosphohydrolase [Oxalobacter aliiformigenes]WAV97551.1 bifunctional (p)ppGpp synthetase/guanosine-3',5'-bis(diphosphate) 3'-pyrophosphohydrolase [Oxalobacter aliifor
MVSSVLITDAIENLTGGLSSDDGRLVMDAYAFARESYADINLDSGQPAIEFSKSIGLILAELNSDAQTRIAGLLAILPKYNPDVAEQIEARFGVEVSNLVDSVRKLFKLRDLTGGLEEIGHGKNAAQIRKAQAETLRKMLLAMAADMRVVMIRLAARMAALRYLARKKDDSDVSRHYAKETLEIYAPLANRLGIWQVKWELEDLSFRFIDPDAYRKIAKSLEEKRTEREDFIRRIMARLKEELDAAGIKAEVTGRPKHIYSIYNKMRGKSLDFSQMYDLRAFRVIVSDIKTCFTVLDIIHRLWTPILKEFDDYISRPKPNGYQSLHTVVVAENGQPFEVQIRTQEMHRLAEFGVAAHWRYKETGGSTFVAQQYDEKISYLRQLLSWKTDVDDAVAEEDTHKEWVEKIKSTTLDDRIYALTPQARVIDLPQGATPIDFAYQVHSDVGHRCRGARVDGVMVPLNTPLKSGQTVEIITAKGATGNIGPSRDWLSPGYAVNPRTHAKIRAWFNGIEYQETIAGGRAVIEKLLQREGKTAVNLEELARKLEFSKVEEMFFAAGKEKLNLRNVEMILHGQETVKETDHDDDIIRKSRASSVASGAKSGILVVGTEGLLTQMAKCCKPAPPDPIIGFVTRGKGVSIHRKDCKNFLEMERKTPERVIQTTWGTPEPDTVYPVDIYVLAGDRQGLLRDISDVFMREKINVVGVRTQSSKGQARMSFTVEIVSTDSLNKAMQMIGEVGGVMQVKRH